MPRIAIWVPVRRSNVPMSQRFKRHPRKDLQDGSAGECMADRRCHVRPVIETVPMRRVSLQLSLSLALRLLSRISSIHSMSLNNNPTFKKTFYQRPLPESCISFTSRRGRSLFASALAQGGLKSFYHLMQQHSTQAEPAYCGISTLTIALNAFALDPRQSWRGTPWRWYDETLLNCCVPLETIRTTGITIPTFSCLAKCQGVDVSVNYAQNVTEDDFRHIVQQACSEGPCLHEHDAALDDNDDGCNHLQHVLVVSYDRSILGQTGTGHFSPIAAYDVASDSVLVMDTARFKYGAHWVSLPLMFRAMQPIDPDTGRSRGFILLTNKVEADEAGQSSSHPLPISLLLRSTMQQAPARRHYKEYLNGIQDRNRQLSSQLSTSWDDVLGYWTKQGEADSIWGFVKPRLRPTPDEAELLDLISEVRALVTALLPSRVKGRTSQERCQCGPHDQRSLDLRADEALYIVYLASLNEEECERMVQSSDIAMGFSETARQQLLSEAKLLRVAIETSDADGTKLLSDNDNP